MKLAAAVILYYPDNALLHNINTYIDDVDMLMVFDNSPINTAQNLLNVNKKIKYYWNGNNEGIAKRLNEAIDICKKEEFDFLLTMDQDSSFAEDDLKKYKSLVEHLLFDNVGMYGVLHDKSQISNHGDSYVLNHLLITSGSIIPVNKIDLLGPFKEELYIDGVDTEFCLRCFELKYNTIKFNTVLLIHQLGTSTQKLTPSLKMEIRKFHSPIRTYYIVRNYLYLRRQYKNQLNHLQLKILINELKNGVLYGKEKMKFIRFAIKGYVDYLNNKMGKTCL